MNQRQGMSHLLQEFVIQCSSFESSILFHIPCFQRIHFWSLMLGVFFHTKGSLLRNDWCFMPHIIIGSECDGWNGLDVPHIRVHRGFSRGDDVGVTEVWDGGGSVEGYKDDLMWLGVNVLWHAGRRFSHI